MAFVQRKITLTFVLGTGTFGSTGSNTVTVSGLRVSASIVNAGGASMGQAMVRIFGLPLSLMNQLAQVLRTSDGSIQTRFNQLQIEAGDDVSGMSIIFQGQITLAPIDMNSYPDSSLVVTAHAGYFEAVKSANPISFPGSADAAVILQNLATQSEYAFENNGVSVMLATPYFHGSPRQQMEQCAQAANINWVIDNGTLAIWPKNGARGGAAPLISADTGMYGYPTNWNLGVAVKTVFNPQLRIGGICQVQSILPFANGQFTMFDVSHELESEMPNGQWFTEFHGSPFNVATQS